MTNNSSKNQTPDTAGIGNVIVGAGWYLPWYAINDLQRKSVDCQIKRTKAAHYTNVKIRINGQWEESEADWIKHLVKIDSAHETKPQVCEMRAIPQTLVDPLMLAAESILSEEHSKIIDQSWETAPFRRLRKALNKLQTYRARSETSVDEEWENAKRAMTGESSLKASDTP